MRLYRVGRVSGRQVKYYLPETHLNNLSEVDMFLNVSALWHEVTSSMFRSVVFSMGEEKLSDVDNEHVKALAMMCEVDMILSDFPPVIVQIQGDEYYVTDKLPDIP